MIFLNPSLIREFGWGTYISSLKNECKNKINDVRYGSQAPAIFLDIREGLSGCDYFGGPWLPRGYGDELSKYTWEMDYPSQILEIPDRRRGIVEVLTEFSSYGEQGNLFNNSKSHLNSLFDGLLLIKDTNKWYNRWSQEINGKKRNLSVPKNPLKALLKDYVMDILKKAPCHPSCHGGELGWSVEKSLNGHLPIGSVLSFDMADAFKSMDAQYVFDFYYRFFEDKVENSNLLRDVSGFLTTISVVRYYDGGWGLPTGSQIGVSLFNRILHPIDEVLGDACNKRNLKYSRWVDDFIISSKEKDRKFEDMGGAIHVLKQDFPIRLEKVFFQQDNSEFYLLGSKVVGNVIVKGDGEELKDRKGAISPEWFMTEWENMAWDF